VHCVPFLFAQGREGRPVGHVDSFEPTVPTIECEHWFLGIYPLPGGSYSRNVEG
jgi:hypothetical protein